MNEEHTIIQQVYAAKTDNQAADRLIEAYMPFIKAETAKFLKRPPASQDDELSIAMIAFHEAIQGYSRMRGAFLKYASMLIKSRLIDYHRRERRHGNLVSLDTPADEDDVPLGDTLTAARDHGEEVSVRDATRNEIEELSRQMDAFGVKLSDVADNCPKQERTLAACRRVLDYARKNPELLDRFVKTGRLPVNELSQGSGTDKKTMERHRKYLAAILLAFTNGYEIIRGHLCQIGPGKGGSGR